MPDGTTDNNTKSNVNHKGRVKEHVSNGDKLINKKIGNCANIGNQRFECSSKRSHILPSLTEFL